LINQMARLASTEAGRAVVCASARSIVAAARTLLSERTGIGVERICSWRLHDGVQAQRAPSLTSDMVSMAEASIRAATGRYSDCLLAYACE
jgi:hypothetical protein